MKRIFLLFLLTVLGALFYCILLESFHYMYFITGFVIALIGVLIFNSRRTVKNFSIKTIIVYIKFLSLLVFNIFKSAVMEIINLLKKRNIKIEKKEHHDEINNITLAKAITLTPGTVTLESDEDYLTVLSFETEKKEKND